MANLFSATRAERAAAKPGATVALLAPGEGSADSGRAPPAAGLALVASFGEPAAADYAALLSHGPVRHVDLTQPAAVEELRVALGSASVSTCVLFLSPWTERQRQALDRLRPLLTATTFVAVVSTFRVHMEDAAAASAEAQALEKLRGCARRVVVIRPGHLVSAHSRTGRRLRRFGCAFPLVPRRLRSCTVSAQELFTAIEAERQAARSRRIITLLGPNRPWRDVLREHRQRGVLSACLTGVAFLLSLLLVGQLAALLFRLVRRWRPALRPLDFDTLRPRSLAELLALCHRHNRPHVKVVGYNNGVIHFGQHHPGKTVVSTARCRRIVRTGPDVIKADGGATIRDATQFLAAGGQELHVLPNYSYVCLGTAFFVPIHGSASEYSTVADTIAKVLLYDPARDRFLLARSDEPDFREHVYDMTSGIVVLRLWLRVKPKARYFVRQEERTDPSGEELLSALRDPQASNVEIRKSKAASSQVRVSTYFAENDASANGLEFPRDALGRLWDRLEENAFTSFLLHAATRYFAWHVELFFSPEEFVRFWQAHKRLPLRKIQLRYIRRDGLLHSAFREHDCVSVDLFLFRWKRGQLDAYLRDTFAVIRTNPGKHSQ